MNPQSGRGAANGDAEQSGVLRFDGFVPRCAALLGIVAAALLVVGLVAWLQGGQESLLAAALSAAICGLCAAAALACAALFRSPELALLQVAVGMIVRMGVPLALVMFVHHTGGRLAEAGMVYYLLTFYLVTLLAEVPLSLSFPAGEPAERTERMA